MQAKALFPFHQHSAWEWNANKSEEVHRPKNLLEKENAQRAESWTLGNSPEAHYLPAPHPVHPSCSAGGTTKLPLPPGAPPKHPGICGQQNRGKMSDEDTGVPGQVMVMGQGGGQGWESKRQMWDVCKAHTWGGWK